MPVGEDGQEAQRDDCLKQRPDQQIGGQSCKRNAMWKYSAMGRATPI